MSKDMSFLIGESGLVGLVTNWRICRKFIGGSTVAKKKAAKKAAPKKAAKKTAKKAAKKKK